MTLCYKYVLVHVVKDPLLVTFSFLSFPLPLFFLQLSGIFPSNIAKGTQILFCDVERCVMLRSEDGRFKIVT
jgi:hypothetical protein